MLRGLWNRLTKYSLISLALAAVTFTLGLINGSEEASTPWITFVAVVLLTMSILIEGIGFFRTRRVSLEYATEIYWKVTRLIQELRSLATVLHTDYDGLTDPHTRYSRDKRYKKMMKKFDQVMMKCDDCGLHRRLSKLIEAERLMAKYCLLSGKSGYWEVLENAHQDVRNYMSVRFQKPEGPEGY